MKVSVIIAIIHMCLGVFLKLFNALYFKRTIQVVFEWIPQILFLALLFGFMDVLIVYKWLTPWDCIVDQTGSGIRCSTERPPPSIISTMMDIGLKVGSTVFFLLFRKKQELCGESLDNLLRIPFKSSSSSSPSSAFLS